MKHLWLCLVAACSTDTLWLGSSEGIEVRKGDWAMDDRGHVLDWWMCITNRRHEPVAAVRVYARVIDETTGRATRFVGQVPGLQPGESAQCPAVPVPAEEWPIMTGRTVIHRIEIDR